MLSFTIHRQPHFKDQKENETVVWIYAPYSDTPGNYIKKYAGDDDVNTVPVYMPYITAYFQMRKKGDRPAVVPAGLVNLAFIGNFAESPTRDTVFTSEYSVRTAMEAVYTLLNVDRGVPEVFNSVYDIRELLKATYYLNDKKPIDQMDQRSRSRGP